jgi:hypothetical protein
MRYESPKSRPISQEAARPARAPDENFLQMVWAIDALQSGREQAAARYIKYPREAATTSSDSRYALRKWDLETLVVQLLVTPKLKRHDGPNRETNCALFLAGATAVNHLRELENAESGIYLRRYSVLNEMHRIGYRQFPWQRGYVDGTELYRSAYVYGGDQCQAHFTARYD